MPVRRTDSQPASRRSPDASPGDGGEWFFSEREGGVSVSPYDSLNLADHVGDASEAVADNRARLARRAGLAPDQIAVMAAAHGNDVAEVQGPGVYPGVDALVTRVPQLGLLALAADCVPLALIDHEAGVAGSVHSGWRGVVANVAEAAVGAMTELGAEPERIEARVGPAICPKCYEVSEEVAMTVAKAVPGSRAETRIGTPAVDVQAGVLAQLEQAGVTSVTRDPRCTFENPAQFFSYRRDGLTGRQGVLVALAERGSDV